MIGQVVGTILVIDGAGSIGWYKQDLMLETSAMARTAFRLLRMALGIALIFAG